MKKWNRITAVMLAALLLNMLWASALAGDEPDWDMTPLPEEWFDDAVIMGDSVTVGLMRYCDEKGGLGDALFLCEVSYGIRNACSGEVKIWYQGEEYKPEEVLPLTGAAKLFVMFGTNDLDLTGGIDYAMERWEEFAAAVKAACPDIQIYVESMLPIWRYIQYTGLNNRNILLYNDRLQEFCREHGFVFVDLDDYFRDEEGGLREEFNLDFYVHVNKAAAELWVEQLKNPANYSMDPRNPDHEEEA